MNRSILGMTDKLMLGEMTLDELTPVELTWIARYAYAQYFYWQHDDRQAATKYYHLADQAANKLVEMIEGVKS